MRSIREQYLDFIRKKVKVSEVFADTIFFQLINHFDIEVLHGLPGFLDIAKIAVAKFSAEQIVYHCISTLIQNNRLDTLDYLVKHCNFVWTEQAKTTLLHAACTHDSLGAMQYALVNGANPNAKNIKGRQVIHRVVVRKANPDLIELLHKHKADINVSYSPSMSLTPLYVATALKNRKAQNVLLNLGAKVDFPVIIGGKQLSNNYKEWCQFISKDKNPLKASLEDDYNLAPQRILSIELAQACLTIFFSPFNLNKFESTSVALLKKAKKGDNELDLPIVSLLLMFHVTIASFNLKKLKAFVSSLIMQYHFSFDATFLALDEQVFPFLRKQVDIKVGDIKKFLTFLIETIDAIYKSPSAKASRYNFIIVRCNSFGLLQYSIELGQKALSLLDIAADSLQENNEALIVTERADIHHNLSLAHVWQLCDSEAMQHAKSAFYSNSANREYLSVLIDLLRLTRNYDEAALLCKEYCQDSKLVKLASDLVQKESMVLPAEVLKEKIQEYDVDMSSLPKDKQGFALSVKASYHVDLNQNDEALSAMALAFENLQESYDQYDTDQLTIDLYNYLLNCFSLKLYDKALTFLETAKTKYFFDYRFPRVIYLEILINFSVGNLNAVEQLLTELNGNCNPKILAELFTTLACHLYLEDAVNFTQVANKSLRFLDQALLLDPENHHAWYYKYLLCAVLQKHQDAQRAAAQLGNMSMLVEVSRQEDLFQLEEKTVSAAYTVITTAEKNDQENDSSSSNVDDTEDAMVRAENASYDPVKLNRYFEMQAKLWLDDAARNIIGTNERGCWVVDGHVYQEGSDGMLKIDSPFYKNYYCILQPGLIKDTTMMKLTQESMQGGLCKRETSNTGVLARRQCWYIKLPGYDKRPAASEMYENSKGQRLIIFNQSLTHPELNKLLRDPRRKMVIKSCADTNSREKNCSPQITLPITTNNFFQPANETTAMPIPLQLSTPSLIDQISTLATAMEPANQHFRLKF